MSRRELREHIFKLLFLIEFHPEEEVKEQVQIYLDCLVDVKEKDYDYMQNKFQLIKEKILEIDETLGSVSKGWTTSRMPKVDLSILRLAVYEMKYDQDIPTSVAINEAVELGKSFGGDDSSAFINAILAKLA